MGKLQPVLVRQIFILLLILLIGILIFKEMTPYLGGVLGAITLYVLFKNWMGRLLQKGWNRNLAAGLLMLVSFIGILLPIAGIVLLLGSKIGKAVNNSEKIIQIVKNQVQTIENSYGYDISTKINTSEITSWISTNLQNLAGGTFEAFIAIGIMYFMLYYMLINRKQLRTAMDDYIPIDHENLELIGRESTSMVKANAIGIPLVAICQGVAALIGFLIFDVPNPFFWFAITTIGAMVPFVGTLLGIVPVTILLFAQGHNAQAISIFVYGFIIVGGIDNLLRIYVLKKLDNVHPLITLLGVVVGVPLFGFIGLIFGPLLISLFMLIVKIYKKEYGKTELETSKHKL
ncbi:MAG TPA: AI-2E family transporter [Flavobacteriaceae bacterium]|nr:AI-2E family transporter [Flavobacteriaceae bacterium]